MRDLGFLATIFSAFNALVSSLSQAGRYSGHTV